MTDRPQGKAATGIILLLVPIYSLMAAAGLAGGFSHCIGMCGIFVVSYSSLPLARGQRRHTHAGRHLLYHAGRLISFTSLGAVGGLVGSLSHRWAVVQSSVSVAVGLLMLALALGMSGLVPRLRIPEPDILGAGGGRGRRLFVRVLQSHSPLRPFFVGIFTGLLPCGLTYYALCATLAATPAHGALVMLCFGLGTVPGLLVLGVFGSAVSGGLMRPRLRLAMTQISAALMAVMGLIFLLRGLPYLA